MATPRQVRRSLRATAGRVARIADTAVQSTATVGVELAADVGGRANGRRLYGDVVDVRNRRGRSSATVIGRPAGYWAIKANGRRGGYLVAGRRGRPLDLRSAGGRRTAARTVRPGAAAGDDRWRRRVVAPLRSEFPRTVRVGLAEAVNDGR